MIQIENLIKEFDDKPILNDISFDVKKGEVFGFLGPNGAGKTTTIKILTTLLRPTDGIVTVAGYDVEQDPLAVRMSFGYVGQQSGVDPAFTIRENLLLQGRLYHLPKETLDRRIKELLALFDMEGREGQWVGSLSGGWKRRVDIATALIHKPKLIFLDEPTIGLDPKSRADLWRYLRRLNQEEGLTIFLTTHHLEEVDQLADRVAILEAGRIRVIGSPDELKDSLGQDVIQMTFSKPIVPAMLAIFKKKEWFEEVIQHGNEVRFYLGQGQQLLPKVIQWIDGLSLTAISVLLARPTFDDVYLKYTGNNWLTADDATEDEWGSWGGDKNNKWAKKWQNKEEGEGETSEAEGASSKNDDSGGEADWQKWGGQATSDWKAEEGQSASAQAEPSETSDETEAAQWPDQQNWQENKATVAEASSKPSSETPSELEKSTQKRDEPEQKTDWAGSNAGESDSEDAPAGEENWQKWGGATGNGSDSSAKNEEEGSSKTDKSDDGDSERWAKKWPQGGDDWPKGSGQ